jgi:hypothetical protein
VPNALVDYAGVRQAFALLSIGLVRGEKAEDRPQFLQIFNQTPLLPSPVSCSAQTGQKHPEPTHRRDRPDITLMLKALRACYATPDKSDPIKKIAIRPEADMLACPIRRAELRIA